MSNVLEVKNVSKSYISYKSELKRIISWFTGAKKDSDFNKVNILRNINLSVKKGESIGVVGKNGAGKSTLLKLISGVLTPSSGTIYVGGRIGAVLELGMGFHPDLTGRENASNTVSIMGLSKKEIAVLINDIEKFADIGEYFNKPVRVYSSGMKARVAFSIATAVRPDVLIVDEALSVGDALFRAQCYERINEFKKLGTTLFLVTHSIGDILKQCDRAILIKDGEIKLDSNPKDVSNQYLDELFGKGNTTPEVVGTEFDNGIEEKYHTHNTYNKNEYRWGECQSKIVDYVITSSSKKYPLSIYSHDVILLKFKAVFHENFENVTAGLLIKTIDGVYVYGTNSYISSQGKEQIVAVEGKVSEFSFEIPFNLAQGNYLISVGLSYGPQENLMPIDRRYDSILINVHQPVVTTGIVDLKAKFKAVVCE